MAELKPIIEQSMVQYAGAVLQSRALVDVRDCIKPSARQVFYSMHKNKLTADKPYKKTNNAIGLAMVDFYIHGDSSCEGIIMRASQKFAMRYPLIDVEGNNGTLIDSGNWAAARYTSARLSKISSLLFEDIDKETIDEWRDNYDDTQQYPAVLPSKGYFNIVNGAMGIGIGMASSIPQYNLREINQALIHLIDNPDCPFEEIFCAPDFATGAILYNLDEVKESMKNGYGLACKLRSVVEFDQKERCFVVTEIPYSVYTNTICKELEAIVESEENPGIERFNDLTGAEPLIKIYLTKIANPDKVLRYLYKNTSLQYYYSINFTMLDQGRFPRTFTWKEILQAHIDHEKEVYRNSFNFDLKKISQRIHIIDGLLICLASIEEVVQLIKSAADTKNAKIGLMQKFLLSDAQADAVLNMKLSRLAHLEVTKLENEKIKLQEEEKRIRTILGDPLLFNNELKAAWREVADKFGDERRTKILNLTDNGNEPIEVKSLVLNLTNKDNLFLTEASSLYIQRRGGVGNKFKLDKDEFIIDSTQGQTTDNILFFTNTGNFYHCKASEFVVGEKTYVGTFFSLQPNEHISAFIALNESLNTEHIIFFTKNGMMKKSKILEYNVTRKGGAKAMDLAPDDEIVSIVFLNDGNVSVLTEQGQFLTFPTKDIRPIGRVAKGVKAIKLNTGDYVISARVLPQGATSIISINESGHIKQTSRSEFPLGTRYTKGNHIQKIPDDGGKIVDFLPISNETTIVVVSTRSQIKLNLREIPELSKTALGVKSINLTATDKIIGLSKF